MSIRSATQTDLPRIVELGSRSLVDGPYAGIIKDNPKQAAIFAADMLRRGRILLAEEDGHVCGLLAFMVADHHFSGQRYAMELMWYIEPKYRPMKGFGDSPALNLLREAERIAKRAGAESFVFTAPNEAIAALYQHYGYSKLEVAYKKEL